MKFLGYYIIMFFCVLLVMWFLPVSQGISYPPLLIILATTTLFVLLVALSVRLIQWHKNPVGIVLTTLFTAFFLPSSELYFQLDKEALLELGSQCIVPFFIGQYNRIRLFPFTRRYILMLLMGIFCSYTHDGITIPLCAGFVWMALINRDHFFRSACWPMVIGFVIGTTISIGQMQLTTEKGYLMQLSEQTSQVFPLLWDTKIFILAVTLTAYISSHRWGRKILLNNWREHTLLACCTLSSLCTMPFAPLGLDNAVQGVCFFCLFWSLIVCKSLLENYLPIFKNKATILRNK